MVIDITIPHSELGQMAAALRRGKALSAINIMPFLGKHVTWFDGNRPSSAQNQRTRRAIKRTPATLGGGRRHCVNSMVNSGVMLTPNNGYEYVFWKNLL